MVTLFPVAMSDYGAHNARIVRAIESAVLGAALFLIACGGGGGVTDPAAPGSPSEGAGVGAAAELIVRAGPLRTDAYGGRYPPAVAVDLDGQGRGWAVWADKSPPRVLATRFDGGWLPPARLHDATLPSDGFPGVDATGAAIEVNRSGRAVAAWMENHGNWITMSSRWDGLAWEPAVRVQDVPTGTYGTRGRGLGIPGRPMISLDEAGNAWLLWFRAPSAFYPNPWPSRLVASGRLAGGAWTPEQIVADESAYSGSAFGIVPLSNGEALAAWTVGNQVRAARVSLSRRWRFEIVGGASGRISGPLVTAMPTGGIVSWGGTDAGGPYAVAVDGELGIEAPIAVAAEGGAPRVLVSANGRILIVWQAAFGFWSRSAESWTAPLGGTVAIAQGLDQPWGLDVAVDPVGNAIAVWADSAGGGRIAASRFAPDRGWTPAETRHQGSDLVDFSSPKAAMDAAGNGVAAFSVTTPSNVASEFEIRGLRFPATR